MQLEHMQTVGAITVDRERRASTHRLMIEAAGARAGPLTRFRHGLGHMLITMGHYVAHGAGHTATH